MRSRIRKAFVLGAGLGTRLRPLTERLPKPLIPVANKPLITCAFNHLLESGVERFIVNTHHRAEAYDSVFPGRTYLQAPIEFRHEPEVLETAGGIKNVEDLLGKEPFIVYNGDILTDLPLEPAVRAHLDRENEVTMVLRSRDGPLQISFDAQTQRVTDIGRQLNSQSHAGHLFTGIYLVRPDFLARIPAKSKISVVPIFREMIRGGARLGGIVIDSGNWWDLGTRGHYLGVHQHLAAASAPSTSHLSRLGCAPWISGTAQISSTVEISGATAVGDHVTIHETARLHDCIVWGGAEIAKASVLDRCVVTAGTCVSGSHADADF